MFVCLVLVVAMMGKIATKLIILSHFRKLPHHFHFYPAIFSSTLLRNLSVSVPVAVSRWLSFVGLQEAGRGGGGGRRRQSEQHSD